MLRLSSSQQDALCVALLAASCLALWLPALDAVSLNPDESQYEATASYLLSTETSAFLPNGAPGVFGLFKLMSWVFGPYPIFQMRVLIQLLAFAIAFLLFRGVRAETTRWYGLLAGLVFLHYVMRYEGLVVNREWFASCVTVVGIATYGAAIKRTGRMRSWLLIGAGFLCGTALWFKLQASFIVFTIPLLLIFEAVQARSARPLLRNLPLFAAGGIGSGVVYLLPFALQGTLSQFLGFFFSDVTVFVEGNATAVQQISGGAETLYRNAFFVERPYRALLLIAYAMPLLYVIAWIRRWLKKGDAAGTFVLRPAVALFAIYLVLSMICVQLGNRFFAHYFQLMLPAVAALVGFAAYFFAKTVRASSFWSAICGALIILYAAERYLELRRAAVWAGKLRWPDGWLVLVFTVLGVSILAYWLRRPLRHAGTALAALLVLQVGGMVIAEQLAPAPQTMQHNRYKFAALTQFFDQNADRDAKLFVWGWAPEIYSLTRLEAASHVTFCQYVANDLKGVPNRPLLNQEWATVLMDELRESKPEYIVDASRSSWYETEPDVYLLANYPEFELNALLREAYVLTVRADGCDVWKRSGDALLPQSAPETRKTLGF